MGEWLDLFGYRCFFGDQVGLITPGVITISSPLWTWGYNPTGVGSQQGWGYRPINTAFGTNVLLCLVYCQS